MKAGARTIIGALAILLSAASTVNADTIGSNLGAPSNASVCKFQVFEPKPQVCTVGQASLSSSHTAGGGLRVPFDGIVVRWSVVSGPALPGTGKVTMALRATQGPGYMEKGPEVELPLGEPGTRYTFAERLAVTAGQPLGLRIAIENRSVEEAGAPIAFAEPGIGRADLWWGDPESAEWDEEEGVELLLDAEIEPDVDRDGYGDLSQDCFPNHPGDQHLCGRDLVPPTTRSRYAKRQAFLSSGHVVVRVSSNEAGVTRASGDLQIKNKGGSGGRGYGMRTVRKPIAAGGQVALRVRVRPQVLRVARLAAAEGRKVVVTGRVGVVDASGNEGQAPFRIRLKAN
ncbi:MAG TPA: hypothetical protein VFR82_14595 [Nitrospira sp.]|nr:hypothetical protein [Nitrospira sp.]